MHIGILGSGLMGSKLGTIFARAASIIASAFGLEMMPSETINVVAPAGGWSACSRTMNAPVAERDSAAARTRDQ